MALTWDSERINKLLFQPHKLAGDSAVQSWVQQHDGLAGAYAYLRALPLKPALQAVLALILDHPGASVVQFQQWLGVERSTYHYRRKQLVEQLVALLNSATPAAATATVVRAADLPLALTPLLGREADLARLHQILTTGPMRLVTLLGIGGVGKTRLVLELAHTWSITPVTFVGLGEVQDAAQLPQLLAQRFGLALHGAATEAALVEHIRAQGGLLILDNFEHLLAASGLLATLLAEAPNLRILVTSRIPLGLYGEQQVLLEPLPVPSAATMQTLPDCAAAPAVQLFMARARAVRPDWALTSENMQAVARLCQRLDGLPLALELAAARVSTLPVTALLERLDNRFRLLNNGAANRPARQQTLQATLDWSFALLPAAAQDLLAHLGVFSGAWSLESASAVALPVEPDSLAASDLIEILVQHQFVLLVATPDMPRFTMLETLRAYAQQLLQVRSDAALIQERFAVAMAARAETLGAHLTGTQQIQAFEVFTLEYASMLAGLEWALDHGARALAERYCWALSPFWINRGLSSVGQRYAERTLACAPAASAFTEARTRTVLAKQLYAMAEYPAARALLEQALTVYAAQQASELEADTLGMLGALHFMLADYAAALRCSEAALARFRELEAEAGIARMLNTLAGISAAREDYPLATRYMAETIALKRAHNDTNGLANGLLNLATVLICQPERVAEAIPWLLEGLALMRQLDVPGEISRALCLLGFALGEQGEAREAAAYVGEALRLDLAHSERRSLMSSLETAAQLASLANDHLGFAAIMGSAMRLREHLHIPLSAASAARIQRYQERSQALVDPYDWESAWNLYASASLTGAVDFACERMALITQAAPQGWMLPVYATRPAD